MYLIAERKILVAPKLPIFIIYFIHPLLIFSYGVNDLITESYIRYMANHTLVYAKV